MTARRRTLVFVTGVVALGTLYRLAFALVSADLVDGDTAVVGLMAKHILEGRHYAFFWGQPYLGTIEPYTVAALGAVLGRSGVTLHAGPLLWGVVHFATLYPLTRRLFDETVGRTTLVLASLAPPLLAIWSSAPRGGYSTALALGHLVLLATIALDRAPRHRTLHGALLGLLAGLAVWTHLLTVSTIVAAAIVLALRDPGFVRRGWFWSGLGALFVGSLPLWVWNARHGWQTFDDFVGSPAMPPIGATLRHLLDPHLAHLLGMRYLARHGDWILSLGAMVGAALIGLLLTGVVVALREFAGRLRRGGGPIGPELFVLHGLLVVALYVPSRFAPLNTDRYLLPLYTSIFPLVAAGGVALARRSRVAAALLAAVVAPVVATGAWAQLAVFRAEPPTAEGFRELTAFLEESDIGQAFADHHEAAVITYASDERVVVRDWRIGRQPVDEIEGWKPRAAIVARRASFERILEGHGLVASIAEVPPRTVFHDITLPHAEGTPLSRKGWHPRASHGSASAAFAVDGDPTTRWGSASPGAPGMWFEVALAAPASVVGIRIDTRGFLHDSTRAVRVEGRSPEGNWSTIREAPELLPGLEFRDGSIRMSTEAILEVRFPPQAIDAIRITRLDQGSIWDWSIGELEVLVESPEIHGSARPASAAGGRRAS